jgi:hypothetical protein
VHDAQQEPHNSVPSSYRRGSVSRSANMVRHARPELRSDRPSVTRPANRVMELRRSKQRRRALVCPFAYSGRDVERLARKTYVYDHVQPLEHQLSAASPATGMCVLSVPRSIGVLIYRRTKESPLRTPWLASSQRILSLNLTSTKSRSEPTTSPSPNIG